MTPPPGSTGCGCGPYDGKPPPDRSYLTGHRFDCPIHALILSEYDPPPAGDDADRDAKPGVDRGGQGGTRPIPAGSE